MPADNALLPQEQAAEQIEQGNDFPPLPLSVLKIGMAWISPTVRSRWSWVFRVSSGVAMVIASSLYRRQGAAEHEIHLLGKLRWLFASTSGAVQCVMCEGKEIISAANPTMAGLKRLLPSRHRGAWR